MEVSNPCANAIDEQSIKQPKSQHDKDESQIHNQNDFKETKKSSRSSSIDEIFEEMKIDNTTAVNSMHAEVIDEISGADDVEAEKVIDSFVVVEVPISKKEIKKWSPKYKKKGGRNLAVYLGKSRSRKKVRFCKYKLAKFQPRTLALTLKSIFLKEMSQILVTTFNVSSI